MVIFCSFVRSEGLCEDIIVSVFIHWESWGNSLKEEVFQIEMHLRLTFPLEMYAGLVYFICALSLGIYSLRPHHLPFRGFPFHLSTHQSGRSQWGWFSCALSCQLETERCSGPQRYRNLQSILGREPKRWSLLQGKKKQTHKTQWLWDCSPPSLCWADEYGSIDIESRENCSLSRPAKNIQCRFLMTGADKCAGEMQAVSLSCWRPVLRNWWGERNCQTLFRPIVSLPRGQWAKWACLPCHPSSLFQI